MNLKKLTTTQDIKSYLSDREIEYVKVGITDIDGVLRGKYMHIDKFLKAIKEGFGFCDVIFGWDNADDLYFLPYTEKNKPFTGWHTGFPDQNLKIVLDSIRNIPFEKNTPLFLAELEMDQICPRGVLKRVLESFNLLGLKAKAAL